MLKFVDFFLNTSPVTGNFIIMMNNLNYAIITTEQQKPSWLHKIEAFPLSREKDFVQIKNIFKEHSWIFQYQQKFLRKI